MCEECQPRGGDLSIGAQPREIYGATVAASAGVL